MGAKTGIKWTAATWNPVVGCTKVSQGCKHCYAKTLHDRRNKAYHEGKPVPPQYALPFEQVQLIPARLDLPLRWRQPKRIFVNSVSDLFHKDVPFQFIAEVFAVMCKAHWHTFQVLTKRPERMREFMDEWELEGCSMSRQADSRLLIIKPPSPYAGAYLLPAPNVWLGTSVERQQEADERIPHLLHTPAAVRFLSAEPLLGPIDLHTIPYQGQEQYYIDVLRREYRTHPTLDYGLSCSFGLASLGRIHWVIVGGESGPGHRPMSLDWARSLRDQCAEGHVAFFYKQLGGDRPGTDEELDGVAIREFPDEPPFAPAA